MKSKTKNLIAVVPLTIAAIGTIAAVVYLYTSADPGRPKPSANSATSATSSRSLEVGNPSAVAPSESSAEAAAKPRNTAERLTHSLSAEQHTRLLALINEGALKELVKIHGVGKTRAEAIQAARPFEFVADLAKVNGVGEITFANVIEHGKQLGDKETVVAAAPPSRR